MVQRLYVAEAKASTYRCYYIRSPSQGPYGEHQKSIKSTVTKLITNAELPSTATNLINSSPATASFYMLPKVHKPNCPGRPIISSHSCPTIYIAQFIDEILRPIVSALPSYVQDFSHALRIFNDQQFGTEPVILFTKDVCSLYTSIPYNEGLEAMQFYLDRRSDKNPSTATILRLTELVLKLSSFILDDQHYLQIKGVALGSKLGPGFVCVYVGYFEERLFQSYNGPLPRLYKRYIDDIKGVMIGTRDNLDTFLQFVSSFSPSLKFTWSISEQECPLLEPKKICAVFEKTQSAQISTYNINSAIIEPDCGTRCVARLFSCFGIM